MNTDDLEIRFSYAEKVLSTIRIEFLKNREVQRITYIKNLDFLKALNNEKAEDIKKLLNEGHKIHLCKKDTKRILVKYPEIML